jgi:hypothetical protein
MIGFISEKRAEELEKKNLYTLVAATVVVQEGEGGEGRRKEGRKEGRSGHHSVSRECNTNVQDTLLIFPPRREHFKRAFKLVTSLDIGIYKLIYSPLDAFQMDICARLSLACCFLVSIA